MAFRFNPLTGQLDMVGSPNGGDIVTHDHNAAGTLLLTWDPASNTYIALGPIPVVDNQGNVVWRG